MERTIRNSVYYEQSAGETTFHFELQTMNYIVFAMLNVKEMGNETRMMV